MSKFITRQRYTLLRWLFVGMVFVASGAFTLTVVGQSDNYEHRAKDVILLIDYSYSMSNNRNIYNQHISIAQKIFDYLNNDARNNGIHNRLGIVNFGQTIPFDDQPQTLTDLPNDQLFTKKIRPFKDGIAGSDFRIAFRSALEDFRVKSYGSGHQKIVIIFSDGEPRLTANPLTEAELFDYFDGTNVDESRGNLKNYIKQLENENVQIILVMIDNYDGEHYDWRDFGLPVDVVYHRDLEQENFNQVVSEVIQKITIENESTPTATITPAPTVTPTLSPTMPATSTVAPIVTHTPSSTPTPTSLSIVMPSLVPNKASATPTPTPTSPPSPPLRSNPLLWFTVVIMLMGGGVGYYFLRIVPFPPRLQDELTDELENDLKGYFKRAESPPGTRPHKGFEKSLKKKVMDQLDKVEKEQSYLNFLTARITEGSALAKVILVAALLQKCDDTKSIENIYAPEYSSHLGDKQILEQAFQRLQGSNLSSLWESYICALDLFSEQKPEKRITLEVMDNLIKQLETEATKENERADRKVRKQFMEAMWLWKYGRTIIAQSEPLIVNPYQLPKMTEILKMENIQEKESVVDDIDTYTLKTSFNYALRISEVNTFQDREEGLNNLEKDINYDDEIPAIERKLLLQIIEYLKRKKIR